MKGSVWSDCDASWDRGADSHVGGSSVEFLLAGYLAEVRNS